MTDVVVLVGAGSIARNINQLQCVVCKTCARTHLAVLRASAQECGVCRRHAQPDAANPDRDDGDASCEFEAIYFPIFN